MPIDSRETLWAELRHRGLIGSTQPERLGGGNLDRADRSKAVYRTVLPDGSFGKVTVGADLHDLSARSRKWAEVVPDIATVPIFQLRIGGTEVLGESYFDGISLNNAVSQRTFSTGTIHRAFNRVVAELQATLVPSTQVARQTEWDCWCRQILALPTWSPTETTFLRAQLLPALGRELMRGAPNQRWVHGDLTDENLLLNQSGDACLIDTEFAQPTHFFGTEAARFHALSISAQKQPGYFSALLPQPDPAWQIHFWLTQIQREAAANTREYVVRWLPSRLSFVRQLATLLPGPELDCPWTTAAVSVPAPPETIQLFWNSGADVPFNEVASERLNCHHDSVQHVFFSIRDRLQPWRIDPSSSDAASVIHRIAVYADNHTILGSFAGEQLNSLAVSTLHDTSLVASSVGLSIQASSGDPQLQISFRGNPALYDAAWLELELYTDRQAQGRLPKPNVRETCRIEEARWLDLAPQKFRIAGWYHNSEHAPVRKFSAIIAGERVASVEPLRRPDVQSHFGGAAAALQSGFQLDLPCTAANEVVSLLVENESGEEFYFDSVAVSTPPKRAVLVDDYRLWAEQHDPDPPASDYTGESKLKFSILLPVYNTDLAHLQQCLSSVRHQHYQNWELCVVDDGSTQTVRGVIDEALRTDQRIKFKRRVVNGGIARATNVALEMATGDYVVLLDHDDLMRPHALAEFAAKLTEDPKLDVVYSDEDKIDPHGVRTAPLLKPDFSPAFLCGTMFVGHLLCVRTTLARSIGGFDPAYDGVQDYEFFLRLTERTSSIGHIQRILYHWRMSPSSSAMAGNVKGNMDDLQLRAVQAHLARTHRSLEAVALGGHRIRLQPSEVDLTGECTVIFLDANDAKDFETSAVIVAPTRDSPGVLAAAKLATTHFVVVVTTAVESEENDWLNHLLILAAEKDVGAVGLVLVNNDGRIASSGVVLNSDGEVVPIMRGFARDGEGYNGSLLCTREVMAMSGSCIAIRREVLLGAANTHDFESFENWAVDLCLTLQSTGLRNLVCASAHLKTARADSAKAHDPSDPERDFLLKKWPSPFANLDRFYPAWCDRRTGDYRLRTDVSDHRPRAAALEFYIDVPTHFRLRGGYLRMRGWCFSPNRNLRHVRLVFPNFELFGRYGTSRPDVSKVYPQATDANIGFELWAIIPPGNHPARLDFQDEAGNWLTATTLELTATRSFFPPWAPVGPGNDLVHFQLGARPSHSPRKVKLENFPRRIPSTVVLPKLSIVTPSYNHRRYLAETLESVVNQTGVDLSYVVQDGGSNDGSIQILEQYADRLSYWESIRDNGQADAIARAFSRTNGEPDDIMAWLNSDDVYLPGTLAFVAEFFARNPDVDAIYGHRILIDENSLEVGRWFLPPHSDEMLKLNDYVPQETLFWRRRLWDRVGGIDPTFKFAMDWDLLLRFAEAKARIVRVPYFLACFRIHAAQKTSSQIDSLGSEEINRLRMQSQGRLLSPSEVENDPRLLSYLRKSAWIEFLWRRFGLRHP